MMARANLTSLVRQVDGGNASITETCRITQALQAQAHLDLELYSMRLGPSASTRRDRPQP
jgi:hypothetical protein